MTRTRHHGYKQKERHKRNDNWWKNEPKWWRKLHKHRKQRQAVRLLCRLAEKNVEDGIWPPDRKPWIYYW